MTVNKPGRPSKADERITGILQATLGVVAKEGLDGVTFAKVAGAAGLQRTLVHHYFSSRAELIDAFIDHAVGLMGTEILHRHDGQSLRQRIERMFATGAYRTREDMVVWAELVAQGARNSSIRDRLQALWCNRWLPDIEAQLAAEYPDISRDAIEATAYGLVCLFEAHWSFSLQGVDEDGRQCQVERAALMLLNSLEQKCDSCNS
jgi:TetR/AcrR family transcriptional repressor of bet genes